MIFVLLVIVLIVAAFYWLNHKVFSQMDSDFLMAILEKYGKKPGDVLKGKRVWITGAASGIGESLVYEMASHKCKLALSDVNNQGLERVKRKIINHHGLSEDDVLLVPFDLMETKKHEEAYKKIISHFKQVDIFYCNAGRAQGSRWHEIDIQVHRDVFEINVFSGVNLSQLLVRGWLAESHPGHIVATSSLAGKFGAPLVASYTASKHALIGYFDCLRNEVASKGIKVTIMCPGPTVTGIINHFLTGKSGEIYNKEIFEMESGEMDNKTLSHETSMSSYRQAKLFAIATANEVTEAWTSRVPFLWIMYFFQYFPAPAKFLAPMLTNRYFLRPLENLIANNQLKL